MLFTTILQVPETKGTFNTYDLSTCLYSTFTGLSLEEMDELFGNSGGLVTADVDRQLAIRRQLGLLFVDPNEKSDHGAVAEEKAEA